MRVTENGMANQYLRNINSAREQVTSLQSQIASGKRVLKTSDDPHATGAILQLNGAIEANDQYARSTGEAESQLESSTASLQNLGYLLLNVKDLVVRAANGANVDSRSVFAVSIDAYLGEAMDIANTKFGGKYIFGGTNTLQQPFELATDRSAVTANPNGIDGTIEYPIRDGLTQASNISGQEAFQGTAVFDLLIRFRNDLTNGQAPASADMAQLDQLMEHVLTVTSKAGSYLQTAQANDTFLASQKTQLMSLLSMQQDADIATSVTDMQRSQTLLDAALNTTARILPKSLLDFLK